MKRDVEKRIEDGGRKERGKADKKENNRENEIKWKKEDIHEK